MGQRLISTWQAAEVFAAGYLRRAGFDDARTTSNGSDGGIDVVGGEVLGQVKHHEKPVGRPDLQRLYGARGAGKHALFFFALSGFTQQAVEYARAHDIALIKYDQWGNAAPITPQAFATHANVQAREAEDDARRALSEQAKSDWSGTHFAVVYGLMLLVAVVGLVVTVSGVVAAGPVVLVSGLIMLTISAGCFIYLYVAGGTVEVPD